MRGECEGGRVRKGCVEKEREGSVDASEDQKEGVRGKTSEGRLEESVIDELECRGKSGWWEDDEGKLSVKTEHM